MTLLAINGDEHIRNTQLSSRLTDYNDALFRKLEYMYQYCREHNIKRNIKLGDINTELNTDLKSIVMNRYILLSKKYSDIEKDSILGNHDMYGCDQNNLYKTSMLTLALAGAFNLLMTPKRFENIQIYVLNVQLELSIKILESLEDPGIPTVILGHHLFEWRLNPDTCLNRKHFEKFATWKYPVIVFLGDDHTQYVPVKLNNVIIHRLGSIMRTEKPSTDEPWQPHFAIFNTNTLAVDYVPIPCESYAEAFGTPTAKMNFTNLANNPLTDMSKLAKSFKQIGKTDYSQLRPSIILRKMNCPAKSFEYLRNLHEALGENF